MDAYTTILAGIAVLLIILLYIIYRSVRELSKPVEPAKPETMKPAEQQKLHEEPTTEPSSLTTVETGAPESISESTPELDEPTEVEAPELIIEPAPLLDEPEAAEPVPEADETIETPRPGWNILDIEGIGPTYTEKLNSLGIKTTADLLEAGSTPKGRKELAKKTGISPKLILEWVNLSDLLRIKGVGEEFSDLLEEAGVDSVPELATRNPENLYAKIIEINEEKQLVRRVMSQDQVRDWIEFAKKLPRKVEH